MNPTWSTWLGQAGAVFDHGRIAHFGDPRAELRAATEASVLCPLVHYGMLVATGADMTVFFQGQFTTDIGRVTSARSQLTAWCSAKGRMLACLRLTRTDDALYLRLPATLIDPVERRLRLFILRAQVDLRDVSTGRVVLGLAGDASPALLAGAIGQVPAATDAVVHAAAISAVRLPGPSPRFELHGPVAPMQSLWQTLARQARPVGTDVWTLGEIRAGLPEVYPATQDAFVPQMANLDLLGGIQFDKGCYVGQEVIARTRYLGRLKRRMYRLRIDTATCPAAGMELFVTDPRGPQSVGQIVQAAPAPEGGCEVLAVIANDQADGPALHLGDADGPVATFLALPYPLA